MRKRYRRPRRDRAMAACAWAILLVAAVLLWSSAAVSAQSPVSVESVSDRTTARIGDHILYTITITAPAGFQVTAPGDTQAFGRFDILERRSPQSRTLGDGRQELRVTFVVSAFRATGDQTLIAPPVAYTTSEGAEGLAAVPGISIAVQSILPEQPPTDIRDLKPQETVPGAPTTWPRWATALIAAVAAAIVIAALLRRALKRQSHDAEVPSILLPEDIARAELDNIASLNLLDQRDYRTYHYLIAGVVRRYLSARYGFPGFARTTSELQSRMPDDGVDRWQARLISGLLRECDAIVYAGYLPAHARADANLTTAYEIVEMTRPEAVTPNATNGNGKVGVA